MALQREQESVPFDPVIKPDIARFPGHKTSPRTTPAAEPSGEEPEVLSLGTVEVPSWLWDTYSMIPRPDAGD